MKQADKRDPNRRNLTDTFIRNLKAPEKKTNYWDTKQRGLCLVVQPTGHKSFKVAYRSGGLLRWYNLGAYEILYLKEARVAAREILARVAVGEDPHLDKIKSRQGVTFRELAAKYQDEYAKKENKSWQQPANLLRWHAYPAFGSRKAASITKGDVRQLFRKLADRPVLANQLLAAVSAVYAWALSEDEPDIIINPATGIKRNPTQARQRVLTDSELRLVWPMFDDFDPMKATALKLVLLTAQRSGEIRHMRGEHIDGSWWTMPGKPEAETGWPGTKNKLDHRVWLSEPAMALLQELGLPESGFVFANERGNPISHLSAVARSISSKLNASHFTVHDCRRTAATGMTGMGINRLTVSRILNHSEGGITKVYDRHSYDVEKQNALDAWAGKLAEILTGEPAPDKVVRLERA